jgi:ERCC4-related helicase
MQDTLNEVGPLIRAHKFVGRANASKDDTDKGLTQKQQKEVRLIGRSFSTAELTSQLKGH